MAAVSSDSYAHSIRESKGAAILPVAVQLLEAKVGMTSFDTSKKLIGIFALPVCHQEALFHCRYAPGVVYVTLVSEARYMPLRHPQRQSCSIS